MLLSDQFGQPVRVDLWSDLVGKLERLAAGETRDSRGRRRRIVRVTSSRCHDNTSAGPLNGRLCKPRPPLPPRRESPAVTRSDLTDGCDKTPLRPAASAPFSLPRAGMPRRASCASESSASDFLIHTTTTSEKENAPLLLSNQNLARSDALHRIFPLRRLLLNICPSFGRC